MIIHEQCSKPLLVDDSFVDYTTLHMLGTTIIQYYRDPEENQPVFHGMRVRDFVSTAHMIFHEVLPNDFPQPEAWVDVLRAEGLEASDENASF